MSAVLDHASALEKLLLEHNVTVFGYERAGDIAIVRFTLADARYRLVVPMPDWEDDAYKLTPSRREIRSITERRRLYWRDVDARWGAMKNLIAAKLGAIGAGITTLDVKFAQFADGVALIRSGEDDA